MFKLFLTATCTLLTVSAWAQFTISGVVRDEKDQRPLAGATIEVDGRNRYAVADEFGRFRIDKMQEGAYTLRIRFLGYYDKIETINLNEKIDIVILLQENPVMTDEVVVTATRVSDKSPTAFTVVNKQSIQKQNFGQDLPFLLNWTPSAVTTSDAGAGVGYTGISIRGSDATRINVTVNGIPYNDSESLGTFWVDVPDIAASSQSVQIQRGVGTSTNGGGAFGATINLQTNTRQDVPYAEIANSFGSFNTHRHSLGFGTGLIKDHWIMDGRVSSIASDGFIDRASSNLQSYYFSGGYYAGKTMVKGIVFGGKERTYQAWYGVPESRLNNDVEAMMVTAANEGWNEAQTENLLNSNSRTFNPYTYKNQVDNYNQDHYQLHVSHRFVNALTFNAALHYTYGRGYYEEYRYDDDIEDYGLPNIIIQDDDGSILDNDTISATDIIRRRWLDNHFYGLTYSLNYEREKYSMILGGAWNRYDGDHFGEILWSAVTIAPLEYQYYFNNGNKRDLNVFFKTTYQFGEKLTALLDLQYRSIDYTLGGIENKQNPIATSVSYGFFNPKAGITYQFNAREQTYLSYSIAHREPVRNDILAASPGSFPKPERLYDLEAGYRKVTDRFALNINYYWMTYKDQLVLTGELNDVGASVRTNVDDSYRTGIEVEGIVKLSKHITWNANLTLSKNKIKTFTEILYDYGVNFEEFNVIERQFNNTHISFSPNVIAGSSFTLTPIRNAEFTLLSKYVGKQYLDNTSNNNRRINSYFVNDIRLSYTWQPSFAREIALSVLINNVFQREYSSNGYTWGYAGGGEEYRENYFYPQAGRHFMAMLTLRI